MIGNCFLSCGIQYSKNEDDSKFFSKIKNQSNGNGKEWCGIIGEIGELSCDG